MLESADDAYSKHDYAKALASYRRVMGFLGLPVSKQARKRLASAKANPTVAANAGDGRLRTCGPSRPFWPGRPRRPLRPGRAGERLLRHEHVPAIVHLKDEDLLTVVDNLERLVQGCQGSFARSRPRIGWPAPRAAGLGGTARGHDRRPRGPRVARAGADVPRRRPVGQGDGAIPQAGRAVPRQPPRPDGRERTGGDGRGEAVRAAQSTLARLPGETVVVV